MNLHDKYTTTCFLRDDLSPISPFFPSHEIAMIHNNSMRNIFQLTDKPCIYVSLRVAT